MEVPDLAVIGGQDGLEGGQIVPVDNDVVVEAGGGAQALGLHGYQFVERHRQVVVLHEDFTFEME